jgi:hypothetical protein
VLSESRRGEGDLQPISFSDLRSRIDPDVASAQFNYHLQQLVGIFVERSGESIAQIDKRMIPEADEGYVLRPEGTMVARKLRANATASDVAVSQPGLDLDCYYCGTPVEATYENAIFRAQCPNCEYVYEHELVPPGGVGDTGDATLDRISTYLWSRRLAFARGGCPLCADALETEFLRPAEIRYPRSDRREVMINRWCTNCGEREYLKVGEVLLREPALVAFCRDHGLDVTSTPLWHLEFVVTDRAISLLSTDPVEVGFELELDGDTLELILNEGVTVQNSS